MVELIGVFSLGILVGTIGTLFSGMMYQFYKMYQNDRTNKNDN